MRPTVSTGRYCTDTGISLAVVVEGQLEDVIQVLRQQEGGVIVGHHHGQDGPHQDVLQAISFLVP